MRTLAAAAATALALVAGPALAVIPPAAVTARVSSGQAYEGFIADPGDLHSFLIEDFYPMTFSISLKAGRGSALLPDISLYDPVETDITAGLAAFRRDGAKSVSVRNAAAFAGEGRHVLQVKGKTGTTGGYILKITAKATKSFKGSGFLDAAETEVIDVLAPTEAKLTLKVVPGAGSTLVPKLTGISGPACTSPSIVPGLTPASGTVQVPLTGIYSVDVQGDGGTGGAFNWTAKVKTAKPSRKPVRVNGGAAAFPEQGPAPAILTESAGQTVFGFDVDATHLAWREVRTSGGGPNGDKNSVQISTLKGGNLPALANNFITDPDPDPRSFALGPTHAVLFDFMGADLYAVPREGGNEVALTTTLGTATRLLADRDFAYAMRDDGIRRYALDASTNQGVSTDGALTYHDMALGGNGIVFAAEDGSGDLVIVMVDRDGNGVQTLATLSPNPGLVGLAARGPDAFFAVDNGTGGTSLYRASACDPGTAIPLCADFDVPVTALAADDQNAYALQNEPTDDGRVVQIPRGGGEPTVLLRGNGSSFQLNMGGLRAAGGYVFVQVQDGGKDSFFRVKRR